MSGMCQMCGGGECKYAKGGMVKHPNDSKQEGVHKAINTMHPGQSSMGSAVRNGDSETAKMRAYDKIKEARNVAEGPSKKPLEGLADGGEVEDMDGGDDELMDMCAEELMNAIESKNKKEMLESLKAIILSCK